MFKEIALLNALIGSTLGLNAASPNSVINKEILNSSSYSLSINGEASLQPHSFLTLNYDESIDLYLNVFSGEEPTDIYYWLNQVDNEEEVLIDWDFVSVIGDTNLYEFLIPSLTSDTVSGIQFFQRKSIVGEVYYLLNGDMSNLAAFNSGNLIEDKTATLGGHGITSLSYKRTKVDKGLIGYCQYIVNGLDDIANNSRTNGGTTVEELTNIMLYDDGWSNRLVFTSGYYSRAYNVNGFAELNPTFFSKEFAGYANRTASNDISISLEPLTVGFDLIAMAFSSVGALFSFMIAPGITLGLLVLVPVILTIILFILKIIKKG